VLKADRAVFGELVGAATNQPMTPRQKGNSKRCVNLSTRELTLTILGIGHDTIMRGMFVSAVVRFALGTSSLYAFYPGSRRYFVVNLYIIKLFTSAV